MSITLTTQTGVRTITTDPLSTPHSSAVAAAAASLAQPALAARLAALAEPSRLRLLFAIHAAPDSSVTALAAAAGMAPNAATKALHSLKRDGIVTVRTDGQRRRWALADEMAHQLLHTAGAPHSVLHPAH